MLFTFNKRIKSQPCITECNTVASEFYSLSLNVPVPLLQKHGFEKIHFQLCIPVNLLLQVQKKVILIRFYSFDWDVKNNAIVWLGTSKFITSTFNFFHFASLSSHYMTKYIIYSLSSSSSLPKVQQIQDIGLDSKVMRIAGI